jgi:hypothetical protein
LILADSIDPQNENPGPGAYENPEATSPRGTYYVTKFHNSQAKILDHAKRFPDLRKMSGDSERKSPGPGSYINYENDLSREGKYVLSKNRGQGTRPFDHQARRSFVDDFSKIHASIICL